MKAPATTIAVFASALVCAVFVTVLSGPLRSPERLSIVLIEGTALASVALAFNRAPSRRDALRIALVAVASQAAYFSLTLIACGASNRAVAVCDGVTIAIANVYGARAIADLTSSYTPRVPTDTRAVATSTALCMTLSFAKVCLVLLLALAVMAAQLETLVLFAFVPSLVWLARYPARLASARGLSGLRRHTAVFVLLMLDGYLVPTGFLLVVVAALRVRVDGAFTYT